MAAKVFCGNYLNYVVDTKLSQQHFDFLLDVLSCVSAYHVISSTFQLN